MCQRPSLLFKAANIHRPEFAEEWSKLPLSITLKNWLSYGVHIPFSSMPDQFELPNHKLTATQVKFVDQELQELLHAGAIEKCDHRPYCVSPIGVVPKKNAKFRLFTDLRRLKDHCGRCSFQYEDVRILSDVIVDNDYMITLDIKNGFHHILVHKDYRDYLGFKWKKHYFRWSVLPFGLSCSPYFFGKILRPVVTY